VRFGLYETLDEIGRGGAGTVYRARSPDGRIVALKLLKRTDGPARERFGREVRLLALLGEEDGFVPLLDSGEVSGAPYLVMPYLEGGTLRLRVEGGPLPVAATRALGIALARALGRAHARGIVHRDLKPENILFAREGDLGSPLIADLGLAKHFRHDLTGGSRSVSLSRFGQFRGTAGYMPNEQMNDAYSAGPQADVFALGAVLHECLTGTPVFAADTLLELMTKVDSGAPPIRSLVRDVPADLASAIDAALQHDPEDRPRDGAAFAQLLAGSAKASPRRSRRPVALLSLGLVGLGAVAALWSSPSEEPKPHADGAERAAALLAASGSERLARGDVAGAVTDLERSVELDARDPRAWLALARARRLAGREGASAAVERALALQPCAEAWAERAVLRFESETTDLAVVDATLALSADPSRALARAARAACLCDRADFAGAAKDAAVAVALAPDDPFALAVQGAASSGLGDRKRAIELLSRAIERDGRCAFAWTWRGIARGAEARADALSDLERALALEPRSTRPLRARIALRHAASDPTRERDALITDLDHLLALGAGAPERRELEGLLLQRATDAFVSGSPSEKKRALADFTRLIELAPGSSVRWANRADGRAFLDDLPGAIEDYTRALALENNERYFKLRADVYVRRSGPGDEARALADLKQVVALARDSSDGADALAEIERLESRRR
jgi:tetratricopeptide (TPR) repeat protein